MNSSRSTSGLRAGGVFDHELVEYLPGLAVCRFTGKRAEETFKDEAGGHRWQRTPPTEKRGRVHTSTVTVAVLPEPTEAQVRLNERDLGWKTCRSSGAGGQNVNKTDSAVQLTHLPTGLMVRCETERSQLQNRATALSLLRARLWAAENERVVGDRAALRHAQVGSGQRGDKRRTIRVQDDQVNDHISGKHWSWRDYSRGIW
jgi:peptide chain release factor 1